MYTGIMTKASSKQKNLDDKPYKVRTKLALIDIKNNKVDHCVASVKYRMLTIVVPKKRG
jgi:hypothetical protein